MRALLLLGLLGSAVTDPAAAQTNCEALAVRGIAAAEAQSWRAAITLLSAAAAKDSLCLTPSGELVGDRLGQLQLSVGDLDGALVTWKRTLSVASEAPGREALVGTYLDVLVRLGYAAGPDATEAFEQLLLPTRSYPPENSPYWRLLSQVASVVPESIADEAFVAGDWQRGITDGRSLAAWWAAEDPYPATEPNERVEEHLLRVSKALADYPDSRSVEGYDDRGRLFVRFGAPQVARQLNFDTSELVLGMSRLSAGITRQSFPDNEVWTYGSIDETMVYIMTARNDVYRIGQARDLLPASLRNVSGRGQRGQMMLQVALLAMRYIYGELATTSMVYGNAWGDTASMLEETNTPFRNMNTAITAVQRSVSLRETEQTRERTAREPASVSRVEMQTPAVNYVADATRFLNANGKTRLELIWGVQPPSEALEAAVLTGSVVEQPGTPQQAVTTTISQSLTQAQLRGVDYAPPSGAVVTCTDYPCTPSVQISLYAADPEGQPVERVGTSVWRVEGSEPLRSEGLEMSDLRPFDPVQNKPMLGLSVEPGMPLSVYFEAYGFEDRAGSTRVTVEYEVVRRRSGSFLRRTRETPSSGDLRLFDRGTTTEQYLILRTADWDDADEVEVRITVRDERTGEAVQRSRTFQVR